MYNFFLILLFAYSFSITTDDIYDDSWALVIGIDNYKYIQDLNYAVNDANAFKKLLIDNYNFKQENVIVLLDEDATYNNIRKNFSLITRSAKEQDRVLIYFAGHGETMDLPGGGEKGYLIPTEGDINDLYLTSLPMDEFKNISLMSKAKHILYLIDACYGGIAAVGTRGLSQANGANYINKITKNSSRQIIAAGGRGEKVIEKPEWGHSAFMKNIKNALLNGNGDLNGDNVITANELGLFLSEKVTIDSDNQQTPQFGRMTSDEGEFVFFIPNMEYTPLDDKQKKINELEKKNAELESKLKFYMQQQPLMFD